MRTPGAARLTRLGGYAFLAGLIALWATLSASGILPGASIPSPLNILAAMADDWARIAAGTLVSVRRTLAAFALGGSTGLCLGLLHGAFPRFRKTTGMCIEGLRPLPSVALIPLAILVVGMGDGLNIAVAAFACAWPAFVSARSGVDGVSPQLVDAALSMGLGRGGIIRGVILPASLPVALTGLRLGLGIAFAVEISVEMVVPKLGVGALAATAALAGRPELLYAAIVAAAMAGLVLNTVFRQAEHLALRRYGPEWSLST